MIVTMLSDYPNCCDNCRREYQQQRLNELYSWITGDYRNRNYGANRNNSPGSHIAARTLRAGSSNNLNFDLSNLRPITPPKQSAEKLNLVSWKTKNYNKRVILHPEKQRQNQEMVRKLAELARIITGS